MPVQCRWVGAAKTLSRSLVVISMSLEKYALETIGWCYDMVNLNAFRFFNHKIYPDMCLLLGFLQCSLAMSSWHCTSWFTSASTPWFFDVLWFFVHHGLVQHGNRVLHGFSCLNVVHQLEDWNKKLSFRD